MSEHPALTERQREVIAAVCSTGTVKGTVTMTRMSESGAYARVNYAMLRCGCPNIYELIRRHACELNGVTSPTTADALTG